MELITLCHIHSPECLPTPHSERPWRRLFTCYGELVEHGKKAISFNIYFAQRRKQKSKKHARNHTPSAVGFSASDEVCMYISWPAVAQQLRPRAISQSSVLLVNDC